MVPGKQNKRTTGFKCKVIQFVREIENHATAIALEFSEIFIHEGEENETIIYVSKNKCSFC